MSISKLIFSKILLLLFAVTSLSGCKKNSSDVDEVAYEVTLVNSSTWNGAFINENAQIISVSGGKSGWKYTFKNTNKLVAAQLDAYPDGTSSSADAIMKIYVNGIVVASSKTSIFPRVLYVFP